MDLKVLSPPPAVVAALASVVSQSTRMVERWCTCFAVVTFDLEMGPTIERTYPAQTPLTKAELTNVCNLSFPDSNMKSLGDMNFCFRLRIGPRHAKPAPAAAAGKQRRMSHSSSADAIAGRDSKNAPAAKSDAAAAVAAEDDESDTDETDTKRPPPAAVAAGSAAATNGSTAGSAASSSAEPSVSDAASLSRFQFVNELPLLFGYVLFRQKRDARIARGFFQKSVVLISPLPLVALFESVVTHVARSVFDYGNSALEAAAQNIANWPDPTPGARLELPLMGHIIKAQLPHFQSLRTVATPVAALTPNTGASVTSTAANSSASAPASAAAAPPIGAAPRSSTPPAGTVQAAIPIPVRPSSPVTPPTTLAAARRSAANLAAAQPAIPLSLAQPKPAAATNATATTATPLSLSESFDHALAAASGSGSGGGTSWFHGVNLYYEFRHQISALWLCWELILCGEPILVVASTAGRCSRAVLALVSLISPLVYRGDYRPYFTIYDPDFKYFGDVHDTDPARLPPVVLGVTNPFFLKALERFPHIICMGDNRSAKTGLVKLPKFTPAPKVIPSLSSAPASSKGGGGDDALKATKGASVVVTKYKPLCVVSKTTLTRLLVPTSEHDETAVIPYDIDEPASPPPVPDDANVKRSASASVASPAGVASTRPAALSSAAPKAVAALPATGEKSHISEINNAVLRRHFVELTNHFLRPFQPYYSCEDAAVLNTLRGDRWNPYLDLPALPRFSEEEFLHRIRHDTTEAELIAFPISGSLNTTKRKRLATLYLRFLRSPHFYPWLHDMRSNTTALLTHYQYVQIKRLSAQQATAPASAVAPTASGSSPAAGAGTGESQFRSFFDGLRLSAALEMLRTAQALHANLLAAATPTTPNTPSAAGSAPAVATTAAAADSKSNAAPAAVTAATAASVSTASADPHLLRAVASHIAIIISFIPSNVLRNGVLPADSPFAPASAPATPNRTSNASTSASTSTASTRSPSVTASVSVSGGTGSASGSGAVSSRRIIGFGSDSSPADAYFISSASAPASTAGAAAATNGSPAARANRPPPVQLFVDDASRSQQPVLLSTSTRLELQLNEKYF